MYLMKYRSFLMKYEKNDTTEIRASDFDNLYILSAFVYYSHQPPKKSVLRNFRLRNQYYVTYFTYETGAT